MESALYKLSPEEIQRRQDAIILSEKGLLYRDEVKQQQIIQFKLPPIHQSLRASPNDVTLSHQTRKAQLSLQGLKAKPQLLEEIKRDLNVGRPYVERKLDSMATKMLRTEKPMVQISHRIYDLYQQLENHEKLLRRRKVAFQKRIGENPLNQTREQTSLIEDIEMQDKMAGFAAMEQRVLRMQQNYDQSLRRRQETMNVVRQNLSALQTQIEEEFSAPPEPVEQMRFRGSQYEQRKQQRMMDYQRYKYGKVWKSHPPPIYTSKQALVEAELKLRQQRQQEQLEYELELQKRNQ